MKITILVDNNAMEGLNSEHGLSMFVEADNHKILFDTAQLDSLEKNIKKLNIDLSTIDTLILSHGHYDHSGGIAEVLSIAPHAKVFMNKAGLVDRYSIRNHIPKPVGIKNVDKQALNSLNSDQFVDSSVPTMISENIGLTGSVPRINDFEDTGGPFFLDKEGLIADPIDDDMGMWIKTDKGLVICVGCSHSGIVNIINYIIKVTGETNIHTLIGGFHLVNADENRIKKTTDNLKKFNIKYLIPCHCTGEKGTKVICDEMGDITTPGLAGYIHSV